MPTAHILLGFPSRVINEGFKTCEPRMSSETTEQDGIIEKALPKSILKNQAPPVCNLCIHHFAKIPQAR